MSDGSVLETYGASYDADARTASGWVASRAGKVRIPSCIILREELH